MSAPDNTQLSSTEVIEFGTFRSPETVMKESELVAKAFARRANQLQLYKQIGPSKHLLIEGWQTLAAMYRVTAGIVSDNYIEIGDAHGYEATAEAIYVPTAQRISTAKAMCLSDEDNWGLRPKYEWENNKKKLVGHVKTPLQQLRSMAQTRACSKVLSNLLKWVARAGGFAGTPAEEMTGEEQNFDADGNPTRQEPREPAAKRQLSGPARPITDKQAGRIWALAHQSGKSREALAAIIGRHGFEAPADVTTDKYDQICAEISAP